MRRIAMLGAGALIAGSLAVSMTPALADDNPPSPECPNGDGTIPGSASSTIVIGPDDGVRYGTIFVDDRDFLDADEDNVAGGLWIYIEENNTPGLTRGGDQVYFHDLDDDGPIPHANNPNVPFIAPIPVLPPNPGGLPVFPNGVTLLPNGFGGGSLAETAGGHDACNEYGGIDEPAAPDAILF